MTHFVEQTHHAQNMTRMDRDRKTRRSPSASMSGSGTTDDCMHVVVEYSTRARPRNRWRMAAIAAFCWEVVLSRGPFNTVKLKASSCAIAQVASPAVTSRRTCKESGTACSAVAFEEAIACRHASIRSCKSCAPPAFMTQEASGIR